MALLKSGFSAVRFRVQVKRTANVADKIMAVTGYCHFILVPFYQAIGCQGF
jgi:hypothetical protein